MESWLKAEKSHNTNIELLAKLKNTEQFKKNNVGPEIVSIQHTPLHNHRSQQVYGKLFKKYGPEIVYIKGSEHMIILKNAGAHTHHINSNNEYKYSTLQQHTRRFIPLTSTNMQKLYLPYWKKDKILVKFLVNSGKKHK